MKIRKIISIILIICCSIIVGNPAFADNNAPSTSTKTITTTRLSGQTQYETAKAISGYYNEGKVKNVILSTGNGFADALSASVLAHQKDAPIMLVDSSVAGSKEAFDYVTQHLDPTGTVYIIGGTGVIGKEFETRLNTLGFYNNVRIAGYDRYETSYELARSLNNTSVSTVVISSGESYSDALSIASFAANKGWPILLTPQNALPQEIKDYLSEKKPSKVYITGGAGVISENVKSEISGIVPEANVERLAGQDRFDTNAIIAQTFNPNPSTVYLATGYGFADALAGSALAAKNGDPIVFIDSSKPTLPKSVASYFGKLYAGKLSPNFVAFGGSGVVSEAALKNLSDLTSGVVKEDSIYSIDDITETVTQNQAYSLPTTVKAKLYNSDTIAVPVKWNPSSVDTSTVGTSTYDGVVDGYAKKSNLILTISEKHLSFDLSDKSNSVLENDIRWWKFDLNALTNGERLYPNFSFNNNCIIATNIGTSLDIPYCYGDNYVKTPEKRGIKIESNGDKIDIMRYQFQNVTLLDESLYAFTSDFFYYITNNDKNSDSLKIYHSIDGNKWETFNCDLSFLSTIKIPEKVYAQSPGLFGWLQPGPDYGNIDSGIDKVALLVKNFYKIGDKYFIAINHCRYYGKDNNGNNRNCIPSEESIKNGVISELLISSPDLHNWKIEKTNNLSEAELLGYSVNVQDVKDLTYQYIPAMNNAFFNVFGDVLDNKKRFLTYSSLNYWMPDFNLISSNNSKYIKTRFMITDNPNGYIAAASVWNTLNISGVFKLDSSGWKMIFPYNTEEIKSTNFEAYFGSDYGKTHSVLPADDQILKFAPLDGKYFVIVNNILYVGKDEE